MLKKALKVAGMMLLISLALYVFPGPTTANIEPASAPVSAAEVNPVVAKADHILEMTQEIKSDLEWVMFLEGIDPVRECQE